MSFIPIELKCTAKKPDGSLVYGVPRVLFQGRVHVWRSTADRSTFHKMFRNYVLALTGKDVSAPTFVISSAAEMAQILEDYPGGKADDAAILAELKALGADADAIRVDLADEEPTTT